MNAVLYMYCNHVGGAMGLSALGGLGQRCWTAGAIGGDGLEWSASIPFVLLGMSPMRLVGVACGRYPAPGRIVGGAKQED